MREKIIVNLKLMKEKKLNKMKNVFPPKISTHEFSFGNGFNQVEVQSN